MKKIFFLLVLVLGTSMAFSQVNNEIANALKQALTIGAEKGSAALAQPDGFLKMQPSKYYYHLKLKKLNPPCDLWV